MTPDEQIRRAEQAKLLLDNPLMAEAMLQIPQTIIESWSELAVENKAQAEELKRLLWAARQFLDIFTVTISGAIVAKNDLLNAETMKIRAEAARKRIYG